jgi:O-antigen ligase
MLARDLIDRTAGLNALLILFGFVAMYMALQRPLLAIEGACGLVFLFVALRAPVVAVAGFFALTFLAGLLDQIAGGSFSPGAWAAKAAGGCLVLAWIFSTLARRMRPVFGPDVLIFAALAFAFIVWCVSSALWATDPHSAVVATARIGQGPLLVIVILAFVQTARAVTALCYTFIIGAALSAGAGMTGLIQTAGDPNRLSGGAGDPNFTAAVLVAAVALALFIALSPGRTRSFRLVTLATSGLCVVGIFLTQSRGGVIALGVVLILSLVFAGRARSQVIGVALLIGSTAVVYLVLLAPAQGVARLSDIRGGGGTGRIDLWAIATQVFRAHPINGVGLDNFTVVSPTYAALTDTNLPRADIVVARRSPVHNTYLEVAAELGVVGELLLLGLFGTALEATRRGVGRLAARSDGSLELAGRGLFVGACGLLTAFVFLSAETEKELWITLGLLLAFGNVTRMTFDAGRVTARVSVARARAD